MVPEVGLEPTLAEANTALNRARLPIPPLRRGEARNERISHQGAVYHPLRDAPATDGAEKKPPCGVGPGPRVRGHRAPRGGVRGARAARLATGLSPSQPRPAPARL